MYKIVKREQIADNIFEFWINAPHVTKTGRAGQFVVIRIDEHGGERIPLTISATKGEDVRIVFMAVGKTTQQLAALEEGGESIRDIAGPLGMRRR